MDLIKPKEKEQIKSVENVDYLENGVSFRRLAEKISLSRTISKTNN